VKAWDNLLLFLAGIPWRSVARIAIALFSFSIVHYVFFMRYFGTGLLFLYPSDFYFQFSFQFAMHAAIAALLGNIVYYSGTDAITILFEDFFRLRQKRAWRAFRFRLIQLRRRNFPRSILISLLSAVFFCIVYLGVLRALFFLLVFYFGVFFISFVDHNRSVFSRASLLVARRRKERLFSSELVAEAFEDVWRRPSEFFREVLRIDPGSILISFSPMILVAAAMSGSLRADNIANNVKVTIASAGKEYVGVVYASSSSGILVYDIAERIGTYLPAGTFVVSSK
jgi:hypothetical protein